MVDESDSPAATADRTLDITGFVCPMTFVRTKLALEKMAPGQRLSVRLRDGEPLVNVPRSVTEMGHKVLTQTTEGDGLHRLLIEVGPHDR